MPIELIEIENFNNWEEYQDAEHRVRQLVKQGRLSECGLDPFESTMYVQVYKTQDGDVWRLAVPDHAFRGYLKRTSLEDQRVASGLIVPRSN